MAVKAKRPISDLLGKGVLPFSIESRILRELGERLVRQPEVAVVELLKNAYDADATTCVVDFKKNESLVVSDNGLGMPFERFSDGWMRIGTSSKMADRKSQKYSRAITGEKGIGRFAVRFLGRKLRLETVSDDMKFNARVRLTAEFDWQQFDKIAELSELVVPYKIERVDSNAQTGTTLTITALRPDAARLDLRKVRTNSIDILTPLRTLFEAALDQGIHENTSSHGQADPGFSLEIRPGSEPQAEAGSDVAAGILNRYVLRATMRFSGDRLTLQIFRQGQSEPYYSINDRVTNLVGELYSDIRFFPFRAGAFTGMPLDGRRAHSWISQNSGVAVFDNTFRVQPYGTEGDDWLQVEQDSVSNRRPPRSSLAAKHFPMSAEEQASTKLSWMLRLPNRAQLLGIVKVRSAKESRGDSDAGLIPAADREGFIENAALSQMRDLVRGAVEAIAFCDRKMQQELLREQERARVAAFRTQTRSAIKEIQANPNINATDKSRIISVISETQSESERRSKASETQIQQLEVMSLLGVVAGFMTHEFGIALQELQTAHKDLTNLAKKDARFSGTSERFATHIDQLKEFVKYSQGYISVAKVKPTNRYTVAPRLQQVRRIFGKYAVERNIAVEINVDRDLQAPLVPVSLYNGIALNLFTNALKAVTARVGNTGNIAFRAWNEGAWHYLEVSDDGIGIPSMLRERVFDPLFTTTQSRNDPLGSGMGLGLALVRRGAEAFRGKAEVVDSPPDFSTCVRVKLPLDGTEDLQ